MSGLLITSLSINLLVFCLLVLLLVFGKQLLKLLAHRYILEPRHQQKRSMFEACLNESNSIIFLGDSITEGGNWEELWPEKNILNRGIGGDTSEGVLNRIDEVLRHQPSKIFICIGTNDLAKGTGSKQIIANYKKILDSIKSHSPATKIYVQSVLPVGKCVLFGHDNTKISVLNLRLRKLCIEENVPFIDLHPLFADAEGYLKKEFTNDQLHLLGTAYLAWKEILSVEMAS
ncbi:MAG: hypothetical protein H6579_09225 [Chitinophagales bacterium]|nr:hypothetical protein [Bacteroidota bacterium]MCB9257299.1 hypothetical protein [Chitinophagales bacterium]